MSIGFGSMGSADPAATLAMARAAARAACVRAVFLTGGSGLAPPPPDEHLFALAAAPHDWLFPRVAAVVHHGGGGTTGAALNAGTPAVVVPFAVDQPFWAGRVVALGTGPAAIPRRALTADRLAAALRLAVHDPAMRARASALGTALRAEDGVAAAVACYDRISLGR